MQARPVRLVGLVQQERPGRPVRLVRLVLLEEQARPVLLDLREMLDQRVIQDSLVYKVRQDPLDLLVMLDQRVPLVVLGVPEVAVRQEEQEPQEMQVRLV